MDALTVGALALRTRRLIGTAAALGLIFWLAWPHVERWLGGEARR